MLHRVATLVLSRPRLVLAAALAALAVGGWLGAGTIGQLRSGGFDSPDSESARAAALAAAVPHLDNGNLVLLVSAPPGADVDDPRVVRAATDAVRRLDAEPDVAVLADYWRAGPAARSALRSADSGKALVVAHLDGDEDAFKTRMSQLEPAYRLDGDGVTIRTGGFAQVIADITNHVKADLTRAELIAVPVTLVLLALIFGSLLAGAMPVLIGIMSIVGTLAVLRLVALVTPVSVFALNLTVALGFGLGIDYALLVVNRFREERAAGLPIPDAVAATVSTAGRTVVYSAATIAVALAALAVFPVYFLRSFAYAGVSVVLVTAVAAVAVLPALLVLAGGRIGPGRATDRRPGRPQRWEAFARAVMRRPWRSALPVLALLGVLWLPLSAVSFGLPDDRVLPRDTSSAREVGDVLRAEFDVRASEAILLVLTPTPTTTESALDGYARAVSALPHVARVEAVGGVYASGARVAAGSPALGNGPVSGMRVLADVPAYDQRAQDLVAALRATPAPAPLLVGGPTARFLDVNATIGARLPWVAGLMAGSTLVLIFLFTGSVVLPLKALALNVVTLGAVLGPMVWIFQQGHAASWLGVTPTPLSVSIPPLMFALAFGLSMDYAVFLLGRIGEERAAGHGTQDAVAYGLARTGRIITAAAGLMSVTFLAFATSSVSFIQMLGLGCALAVVLDATIVRAVLVPALMRLLGDKNWWAPAPLRALHRVAGLSERAPISIRQPHTNPAAMTALISEDSR